MGSAFSQEISLSLTAIQHSDTIMPLCDLGPVAQLGARFNRTEEVAGSNPARSIC